MSFTTGTPQLHTQAGLPTDSGVLALAADWGATDGTVADNYTAVGGATVYARTRGWTALDLSAVVGADGASGAAQFLAAFTVVMGATPGRVRLWVALRRPGAAAGGAAATDGALAGSPNAFVQPNFIVSRTLAGDVYVAQQGPSPGVLDVLRRVEYSWGYRDLSQLPGGTTGQRPATLACTLSLMRY